MKNKRQLNKIVKQLTSSKLKKLEIALIVFYVLFTIFFVVGEVLLLIGHTIGYIFIICAGVICLCIIIFSILINRETKKITKGSFLYLKQLSSLPLDLSLQFVLQLFVSLILYNSNIFLSYSTINTINLSLFALVFTLYIFILPSIQKFLHEKTKEYHGQNKKTNLHLQAKVYSLKVFVNKLFVNICIMTICAFVAICTYFTKLRLFLIPSCMLFLYIIINIIEILHLIKTIYNYKIDTLEQEMLDECIDAGIISPPSTTKTDEHNKN